MKRLGWTAAVVLGMAACAGERTDAELLIPPAEEEPEPPIGFRVSEVTPSPSDTAVDVRTPVVVTFSRPLDSASVEGILTLVALGDTVRGALALDGPNALRFEPSTPLEPGLLVEVATAFSLKSIEGVALDTAWGWSFRTRGSPLGDPAPERLAQLVSVLAADSLRGRASGTGDEARAAAAIARDLEASGVSPLEGPAWLSPFTAETRETPAVVLASRNVLGVVPGRGDLAAEWVVVGAHYDHLGFVERADGSLSIYPGADDNASGTSLVLEVARLWAAAAPDTDAGPRRSVLFALWGAEERGLLGSCSFVDKAIPAPGQIAAIFNFDMVGRLGGNALGVPVAEPDSAWWGVLQDANREDMPLDGTPGCRGCSDHYCFLEAGRPVVMFHTGLHDDYHKPTDVPEKVDYEGLSRIGGLVMRTLWRVAVAEGGLGGG